jgi:hypothetical protein
MTFALYAFGQLLVRRHRLAMMLHQCLMPDAPVWRYQAYLLRPAVPRALAGTLDIREARLDHPIAVPLVQRTYCVKALAALLRFAFLADAPIKSVRLHPDSLTINDRPACCLYACCEDGRVLELRHTDEPSGSVVLLQGSDVDAWFEAERWRAIAPLNRAAASQAPLIEPRRFSSRHFAILRMLGATEAHRNLRAPPPASSNDDLKGFLGQAVADARHSGWSRWSAARRSLNPATAK